MKKIYITKKILTTVVISIILFSFSACNLENKEIIVKGYAEKKIEMDIAYIDIQINESSTEAMTNDKKDLDLLCIKYEIPSINIISTIIDNSYNGTKTSCIYPQIKLMYSIKYNYKSIDSLFNFINELSENRKIIVLHVALDYLDKNNAILELKKLALNNAEEQSKQYLKNSNIKKSKIIDITYDNEIKKKDLANNDSLLYIDCTIEKSKLKQILEITQIQTYGIKVFVTYQKESANN